METNTRPVFAATAAFLILLLGATSSAATYYVSTSGNDSADGRSTSSAH